MANQESTNQHSVSEWLDDLKRGVEGEPQRQIVQRFLHRLELLARTRLKNLRGYEDEQDVALSAMKSFLMRVPVEDIPGLKDRQSLWALLAAITINKAISAQRKQLAQKRDARREQSLEALVSEQPTADLLDSVVHEGNRLLESLDDDVLRKIAQMRMEGFTNEEIAKSIQRSVKTVERKLQLIREKLRAEIGKTHD